MLSLYWFYLWAINVFQLTGIKNIGGWFIWYYLSSFETE